MKKIILVIILSIAFILRVYHLNELPSGFHIDEAQIGYNAYSILKTLKDENGNFLPLHTGFFNEARPMLTIYLTVPWVYLFGLNIFSTRLTNALLGVLAVYLTYLLAQKIVKDEKIPLISGALLAISPWHIILSRSSADGAIGLAFLLLSNVLTVSWVKNKKLIYLILSYFSWILTYFSYTGVRPLVFLHAGFWLGYFILTKRKKNTILMLGSLIIFLIFPVYFTSKSGDALARYKQIGNITKESAEARLQSSFLEDSEKIISLIITRTFHNKLENSIREFSGEYFKYLNFDFLFIHGGFPNRYVVYEQPLQYWLEAPLFLLGLYLILRKLKVENAYILFWLVCGAVPAALTLEDSPNMQRAVYMLPGFQIISSFGIVYLYNLRSKIQSIKVVKIGLTVLPILLIWEISRFLHQYSVHQPIHQPWHRNVEFQQIVPFVTKQEENYDKIILSKLGTEPYLFFLFYNKIDPTLAQRLVKNRNTEGNWSFGKIIFDRRACTAYEYGILEDNTLYGNAGECQNLPGTKIIYTVKRPDNTVAMKFIQKE